MDREGGEAGKATAEVAGVEEKEKGHIDPCRYMCGEVESQGGDVL